jgi:hypothetical protein
VNSPGQGFIVEAYCDTNSVPFLMISENPNPEDSSRFYAHWEGDRYGFDRSLKYVVVPHQFETYNDQTYRRIDKTKKYRIYIGVYFSSYFKSWMPFIDKIEGLMSMEEAAAFEAQQKAEQAAAFAEKTAEKMQAETAARETKQNPGNLDRSLYREITVEDFSFDMVAGKLAAGTKVAFKAKFLIKPTGTTYRFENINAMITLSTTHNFVRDMPDWCFDSYGLGWLSQSSVKIFVTVKKPGQSGECSVDIVEW